MILWYMNNSNEVKTAEIAATREKVNAVISTVGVWIDDGMTWIPPHRILKITIHE
jgi:hypothetical protein